LFAENSSTRFSSRKAREITENRKNPELLNPAQGLTQLRGRVPGFMGQPRSTRVNPEKFKKIKVLIFYIKKLRKNPCKYRLYIFYIMKFKKIF
jgi:hypothetical protein